MSFEFHHIAIACKDIKSTAEKYKLFGYNYGDVIRDKIQKVDILFLTSTNKPLIELVCPYDLNSPLTNILQKHGVTPYHLCFVTENMEVAIKGLAKKGFVLIQNHAKAVAISKRKIAFMYNADSGLIELVEKESI